MRRLIVFAACVLLGLGLLEAGLVVPAHLRAVDAKVLRQAGKGSTSLVEMGLGLAKDNKLGAAQTAIKF